MDDKDRPIATDPGRDFLNEPEGRDVRDLHAPILRELGEPRDGYEPVPIWLIFIFFGLLGWGGWYLGTYNGNWDPLQYNESPAARAGGAAGQAEPADPKVLGRRVYVNNCKACHQADGQGMAGQYPPLTESDWVAGPPETLVRILLHGLEGPVTVKGSPYDNKMPAWGGMMSDDQIAAVLTYVRSNFGNNAAAVAPELVKKLREETRSHTNPWSAAELKALEKP